MNNGTSIPVDQKTKLQVFRESLKLTQKDFGARLFPDFKTGSNIMQKMHFLEKRDISLADIRSQWPERIFAGLVNAFYITADQAKEIVNDLCQSPSIEKIITEQGMNLDQIIDNTVTLRELVRIFNYSDGRTLFPRLSMLSTIPPRAAEREETVFLKSEVCQELGIPDVTEPFLRISEAARMFHLSKNKLGYYAKSGIVKSYSLTRVKGSPIFFRESELRILFTMEIIPSIRYIDTIVSMKFLGKFFVDCMAVVPDDVFGKKQNKELFMDFMVHGLRLEQLSAKYDLGKERSRQIANDTLKNVSQYFSYAFGAVSELEKLRTENVRLQRENNELLLNLQKVDGSAVHHNGVNESMASIFSSSVAAKLLVYGIRELKDLTQWKASDVQRIPGIGGTKMTKLEALLKHKELSFLPEESIVQPGRINGNAQKNLQRDQLFERLTIVLERIEAKL